MKKEFKGLVIGAISTAFIMSSFPAIAENIDVTLNKIKIKVNGTLIDAENILYNGRTYVPLRAISEILNKNVEFDSKTDTANINDKDYSPIENKIGYSREKPAGLNETLKYTFTDGYDSKLNKKEYTANITIKEITRGDAAWQIIKAANMFNKELQNNFDYILTKVEFELLESPDQYDLSGYRFKLLSELGKEYESSFIVLPEPKLDTKLYKGAKHTGYAVFECEHSDAKPLITFGRDYNGNGGVWFKAY